MGTSTIYRSFSCPIHLPPAPCDPSASLASLHPEHLQPSPAPGPKCRVALHLGWPKQKTQRPGEAPKGWKLLRLWFLEEVQNFWKVSEIDPQVGRANLAQKVWIRVRIEHQILQIWCHLGQSYLGSAHGRCLMASSVAFGDDLNMAMPTATWWFNLRPKKEGVVFHVVYQIFQYTR